MILSDVQLFVWWYLSSTMSTKSKDSAKYVRYARKTGCVGFVGAKGWRGGTETLDVPLSDVEILKYFVETSNWFLFRKEDGVVGLMDMYLK
ncbi:hypothetical protein Zmor_022431 [Zophobas morio]|uniref:Uncharacterized protein n=1 Tax=Zophobas morio TaxID=2755281 RepID=A0AA38M5Z4_9CUCU|nr:hypothetical protein Zmor_022431 [Zophobas morio]